MTDGVTLPGAGTEIAADNIGGKMHQRIKLSLGADGTAVDAPGDGTFGMDIDVVRATPIVTALTTLQSAITAIVPDLTGTWGYAAGISGSPTLTGGKRLLAITAIGPPSGDASLTINGGDAIPIPANSAITIGPVVQLVDPTLIFTDTTAYVVEYLSS